MCLWLRRKPSIEETVLDPRFGSTNITAPVEGAYTDPSNPTATRFVASPQIPEVESNNPTPATSPKSLNFNQSATNRTSTGSKSPKTPNSPTSPNPSLLAQMRQKVGRPLSGTTLSTNLSKGSGAKKDLDVERTPVSASSPIEQWPGRM